MFLAVNVGGLKARRACPTSRRSTASWTSSSPRRSPSRILLGRRHAGIATALEIEGGLLRPPVSSPVPRARWSPGRLIATAVSPSCRSAGSALGLIFGAQIEGGVLGVLVVVAIGTLAGVGFGALGMLLAFRAKNASTVQGIFPLVFVSLFVSSAFFPRDLLSAPGRLAGRLQPA
jgi:ABC-2 type transport system permease protein